MRSLWMIVLTASLGCGESAAPPTDAPPDAGAGEYEGLVTKSVAAYDSALRAECDCAARAGSTTSAEDCIAPSASGPSWIACGTTALASYDSPEVRTIARCFTDQLEERSQCLASTGCDSPDRAACEVTGLSCVSGDPTLIVKLIEACPDLGLLSRLTAPTME
jgi:hypothetical protein